MSEVEEPTESNVVLALGGVTHFEPGNVAGSEVMRLRIRFGTADATTLTCEMDAGTVFSIHEGIERHIEASRLDFDSLLSDPLVEPTLPEIQRRCEELTSELDREFNAAATALVPEDFAVVCPEPTDDVVFRLILCARVTGQMLLNFGPLQTVLLKAVIGKAVELGL